MFVRFFFVYAVSQFSCRKYELCSVCIRNTTEITRDPIRVPTALVSSDWRWNHWDKADFQRFQACLVLFFLIAWLELNECYFQSVIIEPRANTWLDILCVTHFSLISDFLWPNTLLCSKNLSEKGCSKELGALPLQGLFSAAGLIILPSSGVGTSGRCPKAWTFRKLPGDVFRGSVQCLKDDNCYRAVHRGSPCPTSPCECPWAALPARARGSHAYWDKFLVLARILESLKTVKEFTK